VGKFMKSILSQIFIEFLQEHVLPHTNSYPGPRSVLIMDNAKIQHDDVSIHLLYYQVFVND
jgi:hypothetical protein